MNNFKYRTLFKAISEQTDLPDNAVIADLGCKDATFLLAFQEAFPNKIKSAVGADITDKWFKNVKYKKPIELKVMNCSKKLNFADNTFDFVFTKDMFECVTDKAFLGILVTEKRWRNGAWNPGFTGSGRPYRRSGTAG